MRPYTQWSDIMQKISQLQLLAVSLYDPQDQLFCIHVFLDSLIPLIQSVITDLLPEIGAKKFWTTVPQ